MELTQVISILDAIIKRAKEAKQDLHPALSSEVNRLILKANAERLEELVGGLKEWT